MTTLVKRSRTSIGSRAAVAVLALALHVFVARSVRAQGARSAPPFPVTSRTVQIRGDEAPFDNVKGVFRVVGNARAVRGNLVLTAREIEHHERESTFVARGRVQASDPSFILGCGVLTYDLARDRGVAEEAPRVTRTAVPGDRGGITTYTELHADRIDFATERRCLRPDEGDMEATGNAVLVRYSVSPGGLQEDYRVTCERMKSFNERKRTAFLGSFRLRSPKVGVDGASATFYQDRNRFYVHDAEAWDITPDGREANRIRGQMISYDVQTETSRVLGTISGSFEEGER